MKLTLALCAIILATSASAAAIAQPDPIGKQRHSHHHILVHIVANMKRTADAEAFCHRVGEPCSKVKRAAEAVADAFAEPKAEPFCHRVGEPCSKVKREAEANAEAFCHRVGEPCSKAKRAADALVAAVAEAQPNPVAYFEALQLRDAFPEADASADAGKSKPSIRYLKHNS